MYSETIVTRYWRKCRIERDEPHDTNATGEVLCCSKVELSRLDSTAPLLSSLREQSVDDNNARRRPNAMQPAGEIPPYGPLYAAVAAATAAAITVIRLPSKLERDVCMHVHAAPHRSDLICTDAHIEER